MESIFGKTSIVIDYTTTPIRGISPTIQTYYEVEGRLTISIDNKCVFTQDNILLFEFAEALNDWKNDPRVDFEYYSMDYQQEPILYFKHENSRSCKLGGVWSDVVCSGIEILGLIQASTIFIKNILKYPALQKDSVELFL